MTGRPVLFLVGFMGSGKSSVGRRLAARLEVPFIDLDERVARHAGKSVRRIFDEDGEPAFREHERAALFALELDDGAVVATGGGACTDDDARAFMDAHGTTVWLHAPLAVIEQRVARDGSRPLFGDPAALAALYEERRSGYASARVRIDADAPSPDDVVERVARAIRQEGEG